MAFYSRNTGSFRRYTQLVSIDGKTARRSFDTHQGVPGMHMVSAWANHSSMVLAQLRVEEKSNEIDAIPELLKLLELSGCVVTIIAPDRGFAGVQIGVRPREQQGERG